MIDSECQWARLIVLQPGDADAISIEAARQILRHNKLVEEHCRDTDDSGSESAVSGNRLPDPSDGTDSA